MGLGRIARTVQEQAQEHTRETDAPRRTDVWSNQANQANQARHAPEAGTGGFLESFMELEADGAFEAERFTGPDGIDARFLAFESRSSGWEDENGNERKGEKNELALFDLTTDIADIDLAVGRYHDETSWTDDGEFELAHGADVWSAMAGREEIDPDSHNDLSVKLGWGLTTPIPSLWSRDHDDDGYNSYGVQVPVGPLTISKESEDPLTDFSFLDRPVDIYEWASGEEVNLTHALADGVAPRPSDTVLETMREHR